MTTIKKLKSAVLVISAIVWNELFNVGLVIAQESEGGYLSARENAGVLSEGLFPSMAKIVLVLIAVIIAIYATLALLKKLMGRRVAGGGSADVIEVIETCYLAPKQSLSLVRIGERSALVGVTDSGIHPVMELSAEETATLMGNSGNNVAKVNFRETLGKAKQKIIDLGGYSAKIRSNSDSSPELKSAPGK